MREFYVLKKTGWFGPLSIREAIDWTGDRTVAGEGPFFRRKNHVPDGRAAPRKRSLTFLKNAVQKGTPGDVFSFRHEAGEISRIREGVPAPEVIDTSGNPKADAYWTAVKDKFGDQGLTFLGAYVCKLIVGTSSHSQHSYGNAVDVGGPTMDFLREVSHWAIAHADDYQLERVIVGDQEWKRGSGTFPYTGEYHYHAHVDFNPNFDPSLPCGVRQ